MRRLLDDLLVGARTSNRFGANDLVRPQPQSTDTLVPTIPPHVFFVGTQKGSVCIADDLAYTAEVAALGACIDYMLFYEARNRLVVLTQALVLVQLQLGPNAKVIPVMKMKVSVAGAERGISGMCWAGPGVVAAATGESLVRFWNLANDETYVISLASVRIDQNAKCAHCLAGPPRTELSSCVGLASLRCLSTAVVARC